MLWLRPAAIFGAKPKAWPRVEAKFGRTVPNIRAIHTQLREAIMLRNPVSPLNPPLRNNDGDAASVKPTQPPRARLAWQINWRWVGFGVVTLCLLKSAIEVGEWAYAQGIKESHALGVGILVFLVTRGIVLIAARI